MSGCSINPLSWGNCAAGGIEHALGGAGNAVASGVFGSIANAFGAAANAAVTWLWEQIGSATAIDLTSAAMTKLYGIAAAIGVLIALAMFAVQVISCALRQDFGGLGRAARGMAISSLGVIFAIGAVAVLLTAVDALSAGVLHAATGQNMTGIGKKLVIADALTGGALNSAGLLLFSLVLLISVVIVWCALMIRKMLIIVAAVFAPIAFAGATSDLTKGWVRKWIEFTVALVFSKLILVIIFMIGLSMVNGAGSTGGVTNQITNLAIGALTLLLGGFAPWIAIKMVHFTGDHFHQVHAQAAGARAGGAAVVAAPQKVSSMHSQASAMHSKITTGGSTGVAGGGKQASASTASGASWSGTSSTAGAAGLAGAAVAAARVPGQAAHRVGQATQQASPPAEQGAAPPQRASPPVVGEHRTRPTPPADTPPKR